jgi:hypothetical protein
MVTVNAADTDGMVAQVELRQNGVLVATDTNAPYAFTLTGLAKGAYTLQARACDNGGDARNAALSIRVDSWFGKWQGENFTMEEVVGGKADAVCDGDGDGRCNLLEYVLRSDPRTADRCPVFGGRLEAGQFVFEAEYLNADPDTVVSWETSTDLIAWSPAVPASAEYSSNGDYERAILRFDIAPGQTRFFLRLKSRLLATP